MDTQEVLYQEYINRPDDEGLNYLLAQDLIENDGWSQEDFATEGWFKNQVNKVKTKTGINAKNELISKGQKMLDIISQKEDYLRNDITDNKELLKKQGWFKNKDLKKRLKKVISQQEQMHTEIKHAKDSLSHAVDSKNGKAIYKWSQEYHGWSANFNQQVDSLKSILNEGKIPGVKTNVSTLRKVGKIGAIAAAIGAGGLVLAKGARKVFKGKLGEKVNKVIGKDKKKPGFFKRNWGKMALGAGAVGTVGAGAALATSSPDDKPKKKK